MSGNEDYCFTSKNFIDSIRAHGVAIKLDEYCVSSDEARRIPHHAILNEAVVSNKLVRNVEGCYIPSRCKYEDGQTLFSLQLLTSLPVNQHFSISETKRSGSKTSRSSYSCPIPRKSMGFLVTYEIDNADPPFASASILVNMAPSIFT